MIASETITFFKSVLFGAAMAIIYDFFRVLRITFPHNKILVFFEDILYFTFFTLANCIFILVIHDGYLRAFLIVGELLGMIMYFFTVSMLMIKALKWIISRIKDTLALVFIKKNNKKHVFKELNEKLDLKKWLFLVYNKL